MNEPAMITQRLQQHDKSNLVKKHHSVNSMKLSLRKGTTIPICQSLSMLCQCSDARVHT